MNLLICPPLQSSQSDPHLIVHPTIMSSYSSTAADGPPREMEKLTQTITKSIQKIIQNGELRLLPLIHINRLPDLGLPLDLILMRHNRLCSSVVNAAHGQPIWHCTGFSRNKTTAVSLSQGEIDSIPVKTAFHCHRL